jgi:RND family efflux transporter MFP subunit
LSFTQPGIIRQIAGGGSLIEAGQIIAKLDDKKTKAKLAQSEAEYRSAKSELNSAVHSRDKSARLVEENILSDIALVEADFAVVIAREKLAVSKAKLQLANNALEECTVLAPFSGAVAAKMVSKGEWVKEGDPFIEFVNLDELSMSIDIPPSMATGLSEGMTTKVLDSSNEVGHASVKIIYPVIDPASGLLRVVWRIQPRSGILLSGRYVSLKSWLSVQSASVEGEK